MLVPRGLVGLIELLNFSFFSITDQGMILNGLPWKRTEIILLFLIASKYCISDCFVDFDGYSISSKGFLPTVPRLSIRCLVSLHSLGCGQFFLS